MLLHLLRYRLKSLLRDKVTVFWSMLFPIILGTLFYLSFGNLNENIEKIPVAAVQVSQTDQTEYFRTYLDTLEEKEIITVQELSEDKALEKLKDLKVQGIYYMKERPELAVSSVGIRSSVLQSVLDSYVKQADLIATVAQEKPESLAKVMSGMDYRDMVEEVDIGGKKTEGSIQYFFALIGMACLYGCFVGFSSVSELQPNLNSVGIRRCITPIHKLVMVFSDIGVSFLMQFFNILILLVYLTQILRIDFGNQIGKIVLIGALGSLIGVASGVLVGSISRWSEGVKVGIMLAISMVGSFLAGLMISQMKGYVEQYCPLLNRINPAAVISDAFYCLSVYDDPARYGKDVMILGIMAAVCMAGAFLMVRRERYDSI